MISLIIYALIVQHVMLVSIICLILDIKDEVTKLNWKVDREREKRRKGCSKHDSKRNV